MTKIESYTSFMEKIAADQSHGYSQASRWGTPDYDCSSLVITALEQAGIPAKSKGATYTGNMYNVLTKLGFKDVIGSVALASGTGMKRGDILLNDVHHVAVYVGNGRMVHARGQSLGSSAPGDQGEEISVSAYRNYPWNHVLRYNEKPEDPGMQYVGLCSVTLPELVPGSYGPAVKSLQTLLNYHKCKGKDGKKLTVDGEFGDNTKHAVRAFQLAQRMENIYYGTVSKLTWAALIDK